MTFDIEAMAAEIMALPLGETEAETSGASDDPPQMIVHHTAPPPPSVTNHAAEVLRKLQQVVLDRSFALGSNCSIKSLDDFPAYLPEDDNPDILIKGRWLERGGSAWWISTAGTGKSIASLQLAMSMSAGKPFANLRPNVREGNGLKFWICQSEDSPSRVTIDREDITAELAEQYPDTDWSEVRKSVKFISINGKVGAEFLNELEAALEIAQKRGQLPDALILNPFLGIIGGPITDGAYVTPFLRGGEINRVKTVGLQAILERFGIGALIFHHTPKPPTEKEVDEWMKSTFPEYQGAGSSDITNWGRSFITMMRVKGEAGIVCLTAGKNGYDLGWTEYDGAPRHYMAYSTATGITGKRRHAWRGLTDEELARVTNDAGVRAQNDLDRIVKALRERPMTANQLKDRMAAEGMKRGAFRMAWETVSANYRQHGLACIEAHVGRIKCWFFGEESAAKMAAFEYENESRND